MTLVSSQSDSEGCGLCEGVIAPLVFQVWRRELNFAPFPQIIRRCLECLTTIFLYQCVFHHIPTPMFKLGANIIYARYTFGPPNVEKQCCAASSAAPLAADADPRGDESTLVSAPVSGRQRGFIALVLAPYRTANDLISQL